MNIDKLKPAPEKTSNHIFTHVPIPKSKLRVTQVNEFLKSVLRNELEKFNKFNNPNKEVQPRPTEKSVSRKNSFNELQINNLQKKNIGNRNIELITQNSSKKNEGKLFIKINKEDSKDRSSSCEKKDTAGMSTKRSTSSSTKKAPLDQINIDNPSFVKLYDDITDERMRLIHYIRQCKHIPRHYHTQ